MTSTAPKVGYIWNTLYSWVDTGTGGFFPSDPSTGSQPISHHIAHSDTKRRLNELIQVSQLRDRLTHMDAAYATEADILRVHTQDYLDGIQAQSALAKGGDGGDGATAFGKGGYEIALLAAGGAIRAVESVLTAEVDRAYALINPPGHHAERATGMGFCMFNNASVAAAYAREHLGVTRVAIVDWDVHHGNGAQDIWWESGDVLAISIHQKNCFPADSGHRHQNGEGAGAGATLNIPLPPGSGNAVYSLAFDDVVLPALRRFKPELIIVASGFDASVLDPLARMMVTKEGFAALTRKVLDVATEVCDGKIAFVQEGGYSPYYLPFCGLGVFEELTESHSGFDDAYHGLISGMGCDDLADHQRAEIAAAAELVANITPGE